MRATGLRNIKEIEVVAPNYPGSCVQNREWALPGAGGRNGAWGFASGVRCL